MAEWAFSNHRDSIVPHEVAARLAESNVIAGADDEVGFAEASRLHGYGLAIVDLLATVGRSRDLAPVGHPESVALLQSFDATLGKLKSAALSVRWPARQLEGYAISAGRSDLAEAAAKVIDASRRAATYSSPQRFAKRIRARDAFGDAVRARDLSELTSILQETQGFVVAGDFVAIGEVVRASDSFTLSLPEVAAMMSNGTMGITGVQEVEYTLGSLSSGVEFWRRLLARPSG